MILLAMLMLHNPSMRIIDQPTVCANFDDENNATIGISDSMGELIAVSYAPCTETTDIGGEF